MQNFLAISEDRCEFGTPNALTWAAKVADSIGFLLGNPEVNV
jgi:hypothetical protein